MNRCPHCNNLVIFGGVKTGDCRYCNRRCQRKHAESALEGAVHGRDAEWEKQKEEAQFLTHYTVDGAKLLRVRCGEEDGWAGDFCGDCGVSVGEFHVPGCDLEVCPKTGSQAISSRSRIEELSTK